MAEDIPLLQSLLSDVFPGVKYVGAEMRRLKDEVKKVCAEMHLVYGEGEEQGGAWVDKVGCRKMGVECRKVGVECRKVGVECRKMG